MQQEKSLHLISMDIPFPPNYGGIIDVFFKLKAFHQLGVKVFLHVFGRSDQNLDNLKKYAEEVYFYPIYNNPLDLFSSRPFSVKCRKGKTVLNNIKKHKAPIFFESFRTMDALYYDDLKDYKKYLRLHNVEQHYFAGLANSETNFLKKKIYELEAKKYFAYETIINDLDEVFTLSHTEQNYIQTKFNKGVLIPVFHGNDEFPKLESFGKYILYHGDLRVADNCKVVEYLIDVFKSTPYPLVIASGAKEEWVNAKIKPYQNIRFIKLKDFNHLLQIFNDAHINISWSFQESGTKLKVVNALFNSRFSIINQNVIDEVDIQNLCFVAKNSSEILYHVDYLLQQPFEFEADYKSTLNRYLNDLDNAKKMLDVMYKND